MPLHYDPIVDGEGGSAATVNARLQDLNDAIDNIAAGLQPSITGWQTLSVAAAQIAIGSIPTNFNGLKLIALLRSDTGATKTTLLMRLNGDSNAANYYARHYELDSGAVTNSAQLGSGANGFDLKNCVTGATAPAGYYGMLELDILRYRDTTARVMKYEGFAQGQVSSELKFHTGGGSYIGANEVTSLLLIPGAGNFAAGSKYILYGIL